MTALLDPTVDEPTRQASLASKPAGHGWSGRNWLAGLAGWFWLAVVLVPLYWIVITSFKAQSDYYQQNAFAPSSNPTLDNYRLVLQNDFLHYFVNSVVVAVGTTVPTILLALMAGVCHRAWCPQQAAQTDPQPVPAGSGHPAAGGDHPHLSGDHQVGVVRQPGRHRDPVDRLRYPAGRTGADQLPARRPPRPVRVDAARRGERVDHALATRLSADQTRAW